MISKEPEADAVLAAAMREPVPPVGPALESLLVKWLSISSLHQPGQANPLRFPFLKWALQGRAQAVLDYLTQSTDVHAADLVAEIERIAALPFPPRNERARKEAYEIWAWLKEELYGTLD